MRAVSTRDVAESPDSENNETNRDHIYLFKPLTRLPTCRVNQKTEYTKCDET